MLEKLNTAGVHRVTAQEQAQTEHGWSPVWSPRQGLAALRLHCKLNQLLLERLQLPLGQLQELRLACGGRGTSARLFAQSRRSIDERWTISTGGGLCQTHELQNPLWHRLWACCAAQNLDKDAVAQPRIRCHDHQDVYIIEELEMHVSAALRHLGHASSNCDDISAYFQAQLCKPHFQATGLANTSNAELASVFPRFASEERNVFQGPDELADRDFFKLAYEECQDQLVQTAWAFFLHAQIVHAIFEGNTLLLAAMSLRLLGLSGPWSFRKVHEFVLHSLELLAEYPLGLQEETVGLKERLAWWQLLDACQLYLSVPVIPRLQARLKNCIAGLQDKRILSPEAGFEPLQELLTRFSSGGDALLLSVDEVCRIREADASFQIFQRTFRGAVIGRLDHSCTMELRPKLLDDIQALSSAPLVRSGPSWIDSRKRQLLHEATASIPTRETSCSVPSVGLVYWEMLGSDGGLSCIGCLSGQYSLQGNLHVQALPLVAVLV